MSGILCNAAANGTTYTNIYYGQVFNITCGLQIGGNDLSNQVTSTFQACIDLCASTAGCVDVSFTGGSGSGSSYVPGTGSGTCYMKKSLYGTGGFQLSAISSATLLYTLPPLSCPSNDTATYNALNGGSYQVQCYQDHNGGDAAMTIVGSYTSCLSTCANTNGCVAVSYAPATGYCYLKNTLNSAVQNHGVWGAQVISNSAPANSAFTVSCPISNGMNVTDTNNATWTIECGVDRPGGDYEQIYTSNLNGCLSACSNQVGCVDISWVPGQNGKCYLKNSQASPVNNAGVWGARLALNETIVAPTNNDAATCAVSFLSGSAGCGNPLPTGQAVNNQYGPISIVLKDGEIRQYYIYIPMNYNPTKPAPLVLGFHGNGEDGSVQIGRGYTSTTWNPNAIGVFPNGVHQSWEGAPYAIAGIDDISFVKQLVSNISATYCVDPNRYYATGHSNGGGFVGTLACDPVASQLFAAFAANSGAFYANNPQNNTASNCNPSAVINPCNPGRLHIPFIEFHGDMDTQIYITGGLHANGAPTQCLPSIAQYMNQWVIRENFTNGTGVATNPVITPLYNNSGSLIGTEYQWGTSNSGIFGEVTRWVITNETHAWWNNVNGWSTTPTMMTFLNQWTLFNAA